MEFIHFLSPSPIPLTRKFRHWMRYIPVGGSGFNLVLYVYILQNIVSTGKGSPPNGSSGRSIALPAAASWYVNHLYV